MKHIGWLAMILLLAGCSKHIPLNRDLTRDEFNHRAAGKRADVVLVDGTRLHWRKIELSPTSLIVHDRYSRDDRAIPLDRLQQIEFRYHLKGAGTGIVSGAAVGTLIGLGFGVLGPAPRLPLAYVVDVSLVGAVLSGAPGLLGGYTYSYLFNVEESGVKSRGRQWVEP